MVEPTGAKAFSRFEWMIALRYLRARRAQGFVSVIAGFSFAGIMLGVATLIVVMSVMNGFHIELMNKIIGINGHVFLQGVERPLDDFEQVTERIRRVKGVTLAIPMVESAAGVSSPYQQTGALVRGIREHARHRRRAHSRDWRGRCLSRPLVTSLTIPVGTPAHASAAASTRA